MPSRLSATGLTRRFNGATVVDGISFDIEPGEIISLLGPSGCGKSTTLRMLAGVEEPDDGSVTLDGEVVCGNGVFVPPEKRSVGMMFQDFALFPHLNVTENVAYGLSGPRGRRKSTALELLDKVHMADYAKVFPHELSGGQQQRVALARSLAPEPRVMLMDEPFSGLDNRLRDGIRDETLGLLKDIGTAVVMVTHEPEEAMRTADRIFLMRDGKIVQSGAPYHVYNTPVDKDAAAFFSDINVLRATVRESTTETPFGTFFAPGHPDGQEVEIVIRPQHLKIDFDRDGRGPDPTDSDGAPALGRVRRARYLGRESLVEFAMEFDGSTIQAMVPGVFLPPEGTVLWLMMRRDRCHVFRA
ncbi:MAG: ABC transporter ATP-binding protein [Pseudomonadota bacterium]